MELIALIVAVHDGLEAADIPHAFGGALALAYVATPRGTVGVDANVFISPDEMTRVDAALAPLGLTRASTEQSVTIAGYRYSHAADPFPVDVFPSLSARYDEIARRCVRHPFGRTDDVLPFLSAEDLCVFKLSFGRPQDWVDLDGVAHARHDLDLEYIEAQVVGLRGPTMYPRMARLRGLVRAAGERDGRDSAT
jgi:hypothetical protein